MPNDRRARHKEGHRQRQAALREAQERARRKRTLVGVAALAALVVAVALAVSLTGGDDGDDDVSAGDETTSTTAPDDQATDTTGAPAGDEFMGPDGNDGAGPFQYGAGECPPPEGGEKVIDFEAPPKQCIDPAKRYTAVVTTDRGTVKVALDTERTPGTTNNFVTLARYRYYDDTALFRAEKETGIIQGGSPHTQDNQDPGPGYPLWDEGGTFPQAPGGDVYGPFRTYPAGTLAMARSQGPDSAGGQFFFVARNADYLGEQGSYVIFGNVTEGLDVLEGIADLDDGQGKPTEPVKIESVVIEEA
jgi:peptidyl-prolyl cis-trans isomerase B (cyclophilin B)